MERKLELSRKDLLILNMLFADEGMKSAVPTRESALTMLEIFSTPALGSGGLTILEMFSTLDGFSTDEPCARPARKADGKRTQYEKRAWRALISRLPEG
jgi:hypothetical protein